MRLPSRTCHVTSCQRSTAGDGADVSPGHREREGREHQPGPLPGPRRHTPSVSSSRVEPPACLAGSRPSRSRAPCRRRPRTPTPRRPPWSKAPVDGRRSATPRRTWQPTASASSCRRAVLDDALGVALDRRRRGRRRRRCSRSATAQLRVVDDVLRLLLVGPRAEEEALSSIHSPISGVTCGRTIGANGRDPVDPVRRCSARWPAVPLDVATASGAESLHRARS